MFQNGLKKMSQTQSKLKEVFTDEVVAKLKANKDEITHELLETMREYGNEGKALALEILDLEKDEEQYYLDSFGHRISLNGNRRLKKPFTKVPTSKIHREEMKRCAEDIHYFKDNYVKIKTPHGVNFPDLRPYQNDFIDSIIPDENEDNVGLLSRQSGKTVTVGIYLAHKYNFGYDLNIGIVGNGGKQAQEFLSSVKNIIIELPIWMQQGVEVWNKKSIENESSMRILTDVPNSDAFRGFTIAILVVDECGFIRPNVWEEFSDSIFPSQAGLAWKKNIIISTANGMNHFYDMVKGARDGVNGMNLFEVDWKDVPRFGPDGKVIPNEEFQAAVIKKRGEMYFNQNFANEFIGSSQTLVSSAKLESMKQAEVLELRDGKLKIYKYPEKDHKYFMVIDASKDGQDFFAVQIIDITGFPFEQVATAQLQVDYLLMPEFIDEWGELYNYPYLIIENNEGAGQSIADQMKNDYEYENLHYDKKSESQTTNLAKSRKAYPGFRTTSKTRKQILQTLKLFIENDQLIINDASTIKEFFRFILIRGKFQADEGAHDDLIMSLAMAFVPFCNTKNFEDMRMVVKNLYMSDEYAEGEDDKEFAELLSIGSFEDYTDETFNPEEQKEYTTIEEAMADNQGFF